MVQSTSLFVKLFTQHSTSYTIYTNDYVLIKLNPLLTGIAKASLDAITGVSVTTGTWSFWYLKDCYTIMLQLTSASITIT